MALRFFLAVSSASALLVSPPTSSGAGSSSISTPESSSRRAALRNGVTSFSAALSAAALLQPNAAAATDFFKKQEGSYMTMDQYNKIKAQGVKDEKLYGTFETLRSKAGQTAEFDKLVNDDKVKDVSALALKWDADIRKELMDKAAEQLTGADKDKGVAISKALLEDLKQLDKLAKAGDKEGIPAVSASVRSKVLEFVALEPQRLQERFGVGDL